MNYRYKVKGIAEKAFILRGMYFRAGADFEAYIADSEMEFVKSHCKLSDVVDSREKAQSPQPVPTNSATTPKGVKNELPKSTNGANKVKSKATV